MHVDTQNVRQDAKAEIEPLSALINPSDVTDNAEEWSDIDTETIRQEASRSVEVIVSENQQPFYDMATDLALEFIKQELPRVPMSDMAFDSMETAVKRGYWPNKMDKYELEELVWENKNDCETKLFHIYRECENEAWGIVQEGMLEGLTDV